MQVQSKPIAPAEETKKEATNKTSLPAKKVEKQTAEIAKDLFGEPEVCGLPQSTVFGY